ncbi:MAG: AAA family ATPase, partial [Gammaproteobacteria bacterium]|nr:AAA family ATPase [Gammaproteobacteria bacterium]
MTQELQVKLLGAPLRITHAGAALTIKRKARALLYYLMVTGRKHERTAILSLLWSEKPKENAANNLRVTLNHLRRHLDGYLSVDRWSIGFNSEMPYWLDVETLKTLLRAPLDTAECLHAIDRLYQGPFLDGFQLAGGSGFHAWVAAQRQELHHRVTQTLHSLALLYKEQENYPAAIVCGLRLLKQEPWREETHRLLMSVYARTGQRSEALNQYRICRQVLEERENRTPAPETGLLYREILASRAERQQQTVLIEPLHCCKDTDDIAEIVERRHVTLMFCQWRTGEAENYSDHPGVVFQPPVQPVQPREFDKLEAWLAQRRQSRQICIKAIERNGGEFIQETGSGLLAAFACSRGGGARRSVQAGLSILESFAVITEGHVPTVGIHRGLIIMETTAIAGDRQQVRIMGEAVERVETIARRALPRTLSICAAVYALIKGFFECTRVQERKNGSLIYRVLKESNADNRLEAALACHHDLTPWINRRHEFDYLLSQWEQVLKGMPSAVLIQGGQGIGKSRLVRRLMDRISQGSSNTLMLKCQCTDSCRHDFFYPIARQLQRRLNSHAVPPADQAGYVAKLLGRYLKAYAQTELKKLAAEFMNLSGDTDAPIKAEIMR